MLDFLPPKPGLSAPPLFKNVYKSLLKMIQTNQNSIRYTDMKITVQIV